MGITLRIFFHILFFSVISYHISFSQDSIKYNNYIGIHPGLAQVTILDEIDDPKIYKGNAFNGFDVIITFNKKKNIIFYTYQILKCKLKPYEDLSNYKENYIDYKFFKASYTYYKFLKSRNNGKNIIYGGLGLYTFNSKRTHHFQNKYNRLVDEPYETFSFDRVSLSLYLKTMLKFNMENNQYFFINLGIPLISFIVRPKTLNPYFISANYNKTYFGSIHNFPGFQSDIMYMKNISKRLSFSLNYSALYYQFKREYMLRSYNRNISVGLYFRFK
ncbi:MAG: hypothetical protein JXB17_10895 [Bacteroidales bacterium]|nr:hypothetical protein [Bacteroidales bacterium]